MTPPNNGGKIVSKSVAIIGTRGYPSYYGGFETAVRKLAPHFASSGWDVTVYGRRGATRSDDPSIDPRIHAEETGGVESRSLSTLSFGLTASIRAFRAKPDVVLVMNVANGFFLPLLRLRGIRTVVNVDGIEWHRAKWGALAKKVFRVGARLTSWFGEELIYDSREIERRWETAFKRTGHFVPYGGDELPLLPVEAGYSTRGYVLVVARFVPENTIPEFLEAASRIAEHIPVVIVGSSGYGGELDARAARLAEGNERINWLGHISDDTRLLSLWQHAAVYFHGHSVGGTNPTLVQAMAAGTPIVARRTAYNAEVLGPGGIFCEPNPDDIARHVIALASNPDAQRASSSENIDRARRAYSWELVCDSYERILTGLLKKESGT